MWWDSKDKKEKENDRSHQDNQKQYCSNCGMNTEFIWDRYSVCKNN